jgi:hypothetical protein
MGSISRIADYKDKKGMRVILLSFLLPAVLLALPFEGVSAKAAGAVELELVGDAQGSAMAFQEWSQLLGKAGIRNVRLRTATDADRTGIQNRGTDQAPIYVVTGVVVSRNELLLPNGRYGRNDLAKLAQWLDNVAQGPAAGKPQKTEFGLTAAQLENVRGDLAVPVGFATSGSNAQRIVEKIAERIQLPLKIDPEVASVLAKSKMEEELAGISCGTALAYVLGMSDYGLQPGIAGDELTYRVVKAQPNVQLWPIGRVGDKTPQEALPGLYEFHSVNVQNVSAATALDTIAKRLKTPVLLDHPALIRHGIDPAHAMVSLPRGRTTYSLALRKLLFQAGLKFEVRYDDAGSPLLWVTSVKPG